MIWDIPIHAEKEIQANRHDFVIKGKKEGGCLLIDTTVPYETNISAKFTGNFSKKTNLEIEINRIWRKKMEAMPAVRFGALGLVKKGLDEITSKISGNINTNEIHTKKKQPTY